MLLKQLQPVGLGENPHWVEKLPEESWWVGELRLAGGGETKHLADTFIGCEVPPVLLPDLLPNCDSK